MKKRQFIENVLKNGGLSACVAVFVMNIFYVILSGECGECIYILPGLPNNEQTLMIQLAVVSYIGFSIGIIATLVEKIQNEHLKLISIELIALIPIILIAEICGLYMEITTRDIIEVMAILILLLGVTNFTVLRISKNVINKINKKLQGK